MPEGNPWTEEDDAMLTDLWLGGMTALKIAERMSERTRNAIIGRVHRLGLQRNISDAETKIPPQSHVRRKRRHPFVRKAPLVLVPEPIIIETRNGVALMELRWHHCREVISLTGAPDGLALYCGKTVIPGKSFCSHHAAKNYVPPQPRLRRRA